MKQSMQQQQQQQQLLVIIIIIIIANIEHHKANYNKEKRRLVQRGAAPKKQFYTQKSDCKARYARCKTFDFLPMGCFGIDFRAPADEGPGVMLPQLFGVTDLDTGVPDLS